MRQLWPSEDTEEEKLKEEKEYNELVERINAVAEEAAEYHRVDTAAIADITDRLNALRTRIDTARLDAIDAFISQLTATNATITNADINALNATLGTFDRVQSNILNGTNGTISNLTSDEANIDELTVGSINIDSFDANNLKAKDADIETAQITEAKIDSADITKGNISNLSSDNANLETAVIDNLSTNLATIAEIQNNRIETEYILHNTEYVAINEQERIIITLPFFVNGVYKLLLTDASESDETIYLSVEALNSANNFIIKFSNSEKYDLLPLASAVFYDNGENNSQCYLEIRTNGRALKLWYGCDSYNTVTPPTITTDWPIDLGNPNAKMYNLSNYAAATLFNRPTISSTGETDISSLTISSSELYSTRTIEPTIYDGSTAKIRIEYTPDQNVNSTEAVKFLSVEAPFLNVADLDVADYFKAPNIYNGVELSGADLTNLPDETLYIPRTGGSRGTITSGIAIYDIPELPATKTDSPVFGDQIRYYSSSLVKAFRGETFIMDEYKPQDGYSLTVDNYNDTFIAQGTNKGLQTTLIKNDETNELYIIIPINYPFLAFFAYKLSDINNDGTTRNYAAIGVNQYMPNHGISTNETTDSPPNWARFDNVDLYKFGNLPVPNERFYINGSMNTVYLPLGWYTVIYPNIGLRTLGQITWTKAGNGARIYRKTTKNNITSTLPLIPYNEVE